MWRPCELSTTPYRIALLDNTIIASQWTSRGCECTDRTRTHCWSCIMHYNGIGSHSIWFKGYVQLSVIFNLKLIICYIYNLLRISTDSHESTVDSRGDIPVCRGVCCATALCALHLPKKVWLCSLTVKSHSQKGIICLKGMKKELHHVCWNQVRWPDSTKLFLMTFHFMIPRH